MRLFNHVTGVVSVFSLVLLSASHVSAAQKDEFADTRVCVKLGLETNHPFEKVCTRKVATVEAAKWTKESESIHFVYQKSGAAFTAGYIKPKMGGGTAFERGQLDFCIMEVPAFRGTDKETAEHNTAIGLAYYYASRDSGSDFTGAKSINIAQRNKNGMFPDNCDVVAASGASWKKAWTKVVEQVSLNSSRNTKFGQDYKQRFTDSLSDLSLAFSLTPVDVEQGLVTARNEENQKEQDRKDARAEVGELLASGSTDGLAFLGVQNSSSAICHNHSEHYAIIQTLNAREETLGLLHEWGAKDVIQYQTVEEVFQATMTSKCRAIVSTPADLAQLQASLQKRNLDVALGWVHVSEEELVAAREIVMETKRVAAAEAEAEAKAAAAAEAEAKEKEQLASRQAKPQTKSGGKYTVGAWEVTTAPNDGFKRVYDISGTEIQFMALSSLTRVDTGTESMASFNIACRKMRNHDWELVMSPLATMSTQVGIKVDGNSSRTHRLDSGDFMSADIPGLLGSMRRGNSLEIVDGNNNYSVSLSGVTALLKDYVSTCADPNIGEVMAAAGISDVAAPAEPNNTSYGEYKGPGSDTYAKFEDQIGSWKVKDEGHPSFEYAEKAGTHMKFSAVLKAENQPSGSSFDVNYVTMACFREDNEDWKFYIHIAPYVGDLVFSTSNSRNYFQQPMVWGSGASVDRRQLGSLITMMTENENMNVTGDNLQGTKRTTSTYNFAGVARVVEQYAHTCPDPIVNTMLASY